MTKAKQLTHFPIISVRILHNLVTFYEPIPLIIFNIFEQTLCTTMKVARDRKNNYIFPFLSGPKENSHIYTHGE